MKTKSIKGKNINDIKVALNQALDDGFQPTLAIIFLDYNKDVSQFCAVFESLNISIFGATCTVSFSDEEIEPGESNILLIDINPDYFKIVIEEYKDSVKQMTYNVGKAGLDTFSNPAYIISVSDMTFPGDQIIKGFVDSVGSDVTVIGGYSGNQQTYKGIVFTNQLTSENGIISLIIDQDKINVKGRAVSGWKAVGTEKTITKSKGQWIMEIDNKPALDVVRRYIGEEILIDNSSDEIVKIDTAYPMQIKREGGSPMMMATILINLKEKSVFTAGPFEEGTKFKFSLPPDFELTNAVIDSTKGIKENELPEIDAMILFSCIGRWVVLGPMASLEVEGLRKTWNKPMAGFFCFGEFGKVPGFNSPEYHGATCSWVALKEK